MDASSIIDTYRAGAEIEEADLIDPETRNRIYADMHRNVLAVDRRLLRQLLLLEMRYRAIESEPQHYFENLYWCGLLLYQIGSLDDVMYLWAAKHVNFDTGCGFDVQFLVGAGVDATLEYLTTNEDPEAKDAMIYIRKCRESGDFDHLGEWLENRLAYYD